MLRDPKAIIPAGDHLRDIAGSRSVPHTNGLTEHTLYHANGKMYAHYFMNRNDRFEGCHREWNKAGVLVSEYHLANGIYHGSFKRWYENGTLKDVAYCVNGNFHGEVKEYFGNGSLCLHTFKDNGEYHGETRWYTSLGAKGSVLDEHRFYMRGLDITYDVTHEIANVCDIRNLTEEDKMMIKLKWGITCIS